MALAPRTRSGGDQGGNRSSVKGAEGKARQRARNSSKATNSGSSGTAKKLSNWPEFDWSEVEDEALPVCDVMGRVVQSQLGSGGYYTMLIAVPMAYAHAALQASLVSNQGNSIFMRLYAVPLPFIEEQVALREGGDEDGDQSTES